MTVVDLLIDPKSGGGDRVWTYRCDEAANVGDAYFAPLAARSVIGFVVRLYRTSEEELGFKFSQLRPLMSKIEGLSLPQPLIELTDFISREYLCSRASTLSALLPPAVRDRLVTLWKLTGNKVEGLTTLQKEVVAALQDQGGQITETKVKPLPAQSVRALRLLKAKGLVEQTLALRPMVEKREPVGLFRLTADNAKIESFLKKEGKRKPAQALTLMRLQAAEYTSLTVAEIRALGAVTDATVKALVSGGFLEPFSDVDARGAQTGPPLNEAQAVAAGAICQAIQASTPDGFLLYGVTGSGKTEVFMRAAAEALRGGRQVLYLVPEIALATQAIALLRARFGRRVAIIHSELPLKERMETWMQIRSGACPIVLGARSGLFAPLDNIGLVIVDEEHETSYKQESTPRYHAKKLAMFLGKVHRAPVVLGSATPSLESFFEAQSGEITLLTLPKRAAAAQLPSVEIEDLTEGYKRHQPALLTPELVVRLEETLAQGRQAILFLNRRAYSPFLICRDCGHQFKCPNCAVSLAYSRRDGRLRCHHCGHTEMPPDLCPACQGSKLNPFGVGTEKVEEAVSAAFPGIAVDRLDRDIARKKGALELTLANFRSGETRILVGTQMVAKGLDFPNVTLVGVIAADVSLNVPDFRSSERTFQLLSQVAGRAGRGQHAGHVVIQTFSPQHIAVACAKTHDYEAFYRQAIEERELALYPPFRKLVNIVFTGENRGDVIRLSEEAARRLTDYESLTVLGPADCALERLQGRWRRHIIVKLAPDHSVSFIRDALQLSLPKSTTLTIDVDPYSLS